MMSDGSLPPFPLQGEEYGREMVAPSGPSKPPPAKGAKGWNVPDEHGASALSWPRQTN